MTIKSILFIVQKAFEAQILRMRGALFTFGLGLVLCAAIVSPEPAFARESDLNESAICIDPKHRHYVVRPLTEAVPVRKKEKLRVRRVLM